MSITASLHSRDLKRHNLVKRSQPKASIVYDSYWKFAHERQEAFFRRLAGGEGPWTEDEVLRTFKFTNVYRASDRVSQYLIRNVIYEGNQSPREIFFRTMLFKFFNRIETWELLTSKIGEITPRKFSPSVYDGVLKRAMQAGETIYSAAYIMPSGAQNFRFQKKHQMHLHLLELMLRDRVPEQLEQANSLRQCFEVIRSYPTMGDFLALQFTTDLNYSTFLNFSEMEFVLPGPGARDGLKKCFSDPGEYSDEDLIRYVAERQEVEFDQRGLKFRSLWGRPMQLIDCQNVFCEIDKYSRVVHPDVPGLSGRTRIKQRFSPKKDLEQPWYPPKWKLNEQIKGQNMVSRQCRAREFVL